MKNVLEMLERSARTYGDKIAFTDERGGVAYSDFLTRCHRVGSRLIRLNARRCPVAVLMEKSVDALAAFFGVVYSGNFYVVIDSQMPDDRIWAIFGTLSPLAVVADRDNLEKAGRVFPDGPVVPYDEAAVYPLDGTGLTEIRRDSIDTDPLYALFTSGSTGTPKGAVLCHRNVLAYIEWVIETFGFDEQTRFGNQTPFYFSMSVLDIYATLWSGGTLHILPKSLFTFPVPLLEYLNSHEVNTLYWVPSALSIVANWKALDVLPVPTLKTVLFAGEVMPVRQLNYWRDKLPDARFANLYGPTEVTDICACYVVDRPFSDDESLPIGYPCNNCGILLLRPDGTPAPPGEEGEICVRGSFLAMGYYGEPAKTAEAFVQNPLNPRYPERIYRTGDLAKVNERGELVYLSRKDFQIKHRGYRIELGEIEAAAASLEGMETSVCVYDDEKSRIVLIYQGRSLDDKTVRESLKRKLPAYMCPDRLIRVEQMPHNRNGKIDRAYLKNNYTALNKKQEDVV